MTEQLNAAGIRGMTVSDVKGAGEQGGEQSAGWMRELEGKPVCYVPP